jgi:ribulose-bisphosphate carboxylase large chain
MSWMHVTYHIHCRPQEIEARAEAVAVEQSVEMPVQAIRQAHVLDDILGKVESIAPIGENRYKVVIRLAAATTGYEPAQFVNMLFGNTSLQESVELVDIELPADLLAAFSGPKYGIAGLRALVNGYGRPLTCTALKPQGISPTALAALCHTFALAGIDFIKDDHGLANQAYAPFAARVTACQRATVQANQQTGLRTYYCPNLSGGPKQLFEQAKIAREEGIAVVMVAPMLVGLPLFYELVQEHLTMPVLGHPALAGAARMAPVLLFGKLFRIFGCDAVIYPNYGGRFSYSQQTCADLAAAARAPWGDLLTAAPTPAGGMTVERVDEMIDFYGPDTMLLIGGGLLTAGEALLERSREFVAKVKAGRGEATVSVVP